MTAGSEGDTGRPSPSLKLSVHHRAEPLRSAPGQVLYSGLTGRVFLAEDAVATALRANGHTPSRLSGELPDRVRESLTRARILLPALLDEAGLIDEFDVALREVRSSVLQFTVVPDAQELSADSLAGRAEALVEAIASRIGMQHPSRAFVHLWFFEEWQLPFVNAVLDALDAWLLREGARPPMITMTLNTSGLLPFRFDGVRALRRAKSYYCVYTDPLLAVDADGLRAYVGQVAKSMLAAGEVGVIPLLHMNVCRGEERAHLDEAFEAFMDSGVFYSLITTFNVLPVTRRRSLTELYCPLHGQDGVLYGELCRLMSSREKYRLFTVIGGVAAKLSRCIQRTADVLMPDTSACPILPNGWVLTSSGGVWSCPVAALAFDRESSARLGEYLPAWRVDPDRERRWRERRSPRMEACKGCPDVLVCGGGCPYDSLSCGRPLEDPVCPPVASLVAAAADAYADCFPRLG